MSKTSTSRKVLCKGLQLFGLRDRALQSLRLGSISATFTMALVVPAKAPLQSLRLGSISATAPFSFSVT
jgi:hypothetical protein